MSDIPDVVLPEEPAKTACPECGKLIKVIGFNNHMKDVHGIQNAEPNFLPAVKDPAKIRCKHCNKVVHKTGLLQHLRAAHPEPKAKKNKASTTLPKASTRLPADGLPVVPEDQLPEGAIQVDDYRPAYRQKCCNCGQSPVVKGVKDGKIVYDGEMCGPCTWGESETIDPDKW